MCRMLNARWLFGAACAAALFASGAEKKMIGHSWDLLGVRPADVARNLDAWERVPLDGISLALNSRQRNGKVKFVGFDSSDAMIDDLRTGTLHATVIQDAFRLGYDPVRILIEKAQGITPPKQLDLPARIVTAADLNNAEILELLKPDVKKYL